MTIFCASFDETANSDKLFISTIIVSDDHDPCNSADHDPSNSIQF